MKSTSYPLLLLASLITVLSTSCKKEVEVEPHAEPQIGKRIKEIETRTDNELNSISRYSYDGQNLQRLSRYFFENGVIDDSIQSQFDYVDGWHIQTDFAYDNSVWKAVNYKRITLDEQDRWSTYEFYNTDEFGNGLLISRQIFEYTDEGLSLWLREGYSPLSPNVVTVDSFLFVHDQNVIHRIGTRSVLSNGVHYSINADTLNFLAGSIQSAVFYSALNSQEDPSLDRTVTFSWSGMNIVQLETTYATGQQSSTQYSYDEENYLIHSNTIGVGPNTESIYTYEMGNGNYYPLLISPWTKLQQTPLAR